MINGQGAPPKFTLKGKCSTGNSAGHRGPVVEHRIATWQDWLPCRSRPKSERIRSAAERSSIIVMASKTRADRGAGAGHFGDRPVRRDLSPTWLPAARSCTTCLPGTTGAVFGSPITVSRSTPALMRRMAALSEAMRVRITSFFRLGSSDCAKARPFPLGTYRGPHGTGFFRSFFIGTTP